MTNEMENKLREKAERFVKKPYLKVTEAIDLLTRIFIEIRNEAVEEAGKDAIDEYEKRKEMEKFYAEQVELANKYFAKFKAARNMFAEELLQHYVNVKDMQHAQAKADLLIAEEEKRLGDIREER